MSLNIDIMELPREIKNELVRLSDTYEFTKLSDKGANGYLFIAHNRVLDRPVAIKFYHWGDGVRAHIEPKSLAQIGSPSVIPVLDASLVSDEWALFVTPFFENGDLDGYMETHRFGLRESLRFASDLLHGVAAMHEQGFVHRDLKPENLLVSDNGSPLIADFGSVRLIPSGDTDVPGSGHAVLFRPPESFQTGRYDRRGDLYQCGLVLFQMLGGRLSYSGTDYLSGTERRRYSEMTDEYDRSQLIDNAIRSMVCAGGLIDIKTLPYFVPRSARKIISKATAIQPGKRFATASEFINALSTVAHRVVDWRFEGADPVAHGNGCRLRVERIGAEYCVQKDRGNGWRRLVGSAPGSIAMAVKEIEKHVL
jgi:eukaryotic-like serine/threonine-protein kinase